MKKNSLALSITHLLSALLFVALLLLPAVYGLGIPHAGDSKPKMALKSPGFQKEAIWEPAYYKAWTRYAQNLVTVNSPLTGVKSWIDYRLFAMTDAKGIHVGRQGWLFDEKALESYQKRGCDKAEHIGRQIMNIRSASRLAELAGRRFIFSIIPGKSTIYPEYVGPVPQNQPCGKSMYDIFLSHHQTNPIEAFVPLDQSLLAAKSPQRLLYDVSSRYWNAEGAKIAAPALLKTLFGETQDNHGADADDLNQALMSVAGGKSAVNGDKPLPAGKKHYSACVLYGGAATTHLLPSFIPQFDRVDVIDSPNIPSLNHNEDLAAYDTIVALIDESELSALNLDMDRFCRMLGAEASAGARHTIDLQTVKAKTGSALHIEQDRLVIKSIGATAFIELPGLPGSDNHSLRILKLDLTSPQRGELTWAVSGETTLRGIRQLRSGSNQLYLPLPPRKMVRLLLNTGQTAGIFQLKKAELLSYGDAAALILPRPNQEQQPEDKAVSSTGSDTDSRYDRLTVPEVQPDIVLNDIQQGRIFQRRGTTCDIFISGSYRSRPKAVEAAVLQYDDDQVVIPWKVVDATPANGIFMGVLPGVPQGGWYRLAVRFADRTSVTDRGDAPWGVGLLVACIGQSNMREWFHTGSDLAPHDLMSIHRNGQWETKKASGNGAVAFANRLGTHLGIPVGLLDYAVNGTGLCREADWGKGYWADRSPQGIYRQFIQGVTTAGGAVEYVIWMQGEADAARKTITGNQYRKTLNKFITRQVRSDIVNGSSQANLPFLVIGMVKRPVGQDQPHQSIRNALISVTRETADCYLAATTLDLKNLGRQHLTPQAYTQLGRRVAQTVLHLLGKTDYYRGPHIVAAEKTDATTIELRMAHRGGNDFSPAQGISGFTVFSGNTPVTIDAVNRVAGDKIRIHLGQATQPPLRLTYLYGAMPNSKNAVHDNSALQLPLEPFETVLD
jgi:hypothetical protein